jgi:hypothetical protein
LENTGIVEIPKKVDRRREVVKNEIWLSIQSRPYLAWAIRLRRMQRPAFWIEGGDYVGKVMGAMRIPIIRDSIVGKSFFRDDGRLEETEASSMTKLLNPIRNHQNYEKGY